MSAETDRELLELAAKAAGYKVQQDTWCNELIRATDDGADVCSWNPLTDDGDALRLLVALRINIEHMSYIKGGGDFGVNCWPRGRGDCGVSEDENISDYPAATRRAIVRAAAEIGKAMK